MSDLEFLSPIVKTKDGQTGVVITDESDFGKVLVKAGPETAAAAHLGVPFGSSAINGVTMILGTRPNEWMLVFGQEDPFLASVPTEGFVSLIDWTHSRGMLRVSGADSARALEKVCNMDLSDHMTPDGAVTSISVASVGTDFVRNDQDGVRSYLLLFDRSFGQSLYDGLIDAAGEFQQ